MPQIHKWFTADTHFGSDSNDILRREMRPFKDAAEYIHEVVRIWNEQVQEDDVIYVVGDFCNYNSFEKDFHSGLAVSRRINAHISLITGTSEERVIQKHFGGDFEVFREYCLKNGNFDDVKRNDYTVVCGKTFFLTHRPIDHDRHGLTLFGHTHRSCGLWKPFGFNIGVDLNHFRLFSEADIQNLMEQKLWWDSDPDNNCFT